MLRGIIAWLTSLTSSARTALDSPSRVRDTAFVAQNELGLPAASRRPWLRIKSPRLILALVSIVLFFSLFALNIYVVGRPERPFNYALLNRFKQLDRPKRFGLGAAPAGEFFDANELHDRYAAMNETELIRANAELLRSYLQNFRGSRRFVSYAIGRYTIFAARELNQNDIFPSGAVALAKALDCNGLILEHVFPADVEATPVVKRTLQNGLEINLQSGLDRSVVIHIERLTDGRVIITAVPLLYGTYTVTSGVGTFQLEPPLRLNIEAGLPLFKGGVQD
ncbi:MAG: hypothetical protein QOI04_184 [Verrucomicrobiota bacterium]|jgi:hypothetical protein